jgi:PAT family beta-lactamase induction signal transducer AmpG
LQDLSFPLSVAWALAYVTMAAFVIIGVLTTFAATEPNTSAVANAEHAGHARENPLRRVIAAAIGAAVDFLKRDNVVAVLAFVVLFKFTDALAGIMTESFVVDLGFSDEEYATIVKSVGLAATLAGGFAGGFVARAYPLSTSLWIGGILQAVANFGFSGLAMMGHNTWMLGFANCMENFTSGIGTVIFVAYLSSLCRNPLHTATQYALLTALSAFGRTYLSAGAGYIAAATGWAAFFAICAAAAIPGLILLAWLQQRGHFKELARTAQPAA